MKNQKSVLVNFSVALLVISMTSCSVNVTSAPTPLSPPGATLTPLPPADSTARNFAKLGLLYLRDGVWDGERILPEGWVEYSRAPSNSTPEYGAGWWLDLERPGVFYAVGIRGQVITVDLDRNLTFVTLATDSSTSLPVSEAILDAFAAQP